jgi:ubiquitin-like protein Pup
MSDIGSKQEPSGTGRGVVMASKDSGGQERAGKATEQTEEVVDETTTDVHERVEELTSDVDDLLDEIDEVLESNAEEFVKGYVQKGGE